MIVGTIGDWYDVDYTLKGDSRFRSFKFHTLKHHDVPQQIRDAIARKTGVGPESVELYHVVRVAM